VKHLPAGVDMDILPLDRPRWGRGPLHVLYSQAQAWRLQHRIRPSVVYAIGSIGYSGPRQATVTMVENAARVRDLRWPSLGTVVYLALRRLLILLAALRSTKVIVVSRFTRDILPLGVGRARTAIVYHGAPTLDLDEIHPTVTGDDESTKVALVIGGLSPYRGIETAIRALASSEAEWHLKIVGGRGDPRYVGRCSSLARDLGVQDRVHWLGEVETRPLFSMMQSCDLVFITSRAEACPNTLLEAAALTPRRPILGLSYRWSDEYDALFDARVDPESSAVALNNLSTVSEATTIRRRKEALLRFQWQRSADEATSLLRSVSRGSPRGRRVP
jgi:glycosyltransferase involved in cell wall biosynthesis